MTFLGQLLTPNCSLLSWFLSEIKVYCKEVQRYCISDEKYFSLVFFLTCSAHFQSAGPGPSSDSKALSHRCPFHCFYSHGSDFSLQSTCNSLTRTCLSLILCLIMLSWMSSLCSGEHLASPVRHVFSVSVLGFTATDAGHVCHRWWITSLMSYHFILFPVKSHF